MGWFTSLLRGFTESTPPVGKKGAIFLALDVQVGNPCQTNQKKKQKITLNPSVPLDCTFGGPKVQTFLSSFVSSGIGFLSGFLL